MREYELVNDVIKHLKNNINRIDKKTLKEIIYAKNKNFYRKIIEILELTEYDKTQNISGISYKSKLIIYEYIKSCLL